MKTTLAAAARDCTNTSMKIQANIFFSLSVPEIAFSQVSITHTYHPAIELNNLLLEHEIQNKSERETHENEEEGTNHKRCQ